MEARRSLPELPSMMARRHLDPAEMPAAGASTGLIMRYVRCPLPSEHLLDTGAMDRPRARWTELRKGCGASDACCTPAYASVSSPPALFKDPHVERFMEVVEAAASMLQRQDPSNTVNPTLAACLALYAHNTSQKNIPSFNATAALATNGR